MSVQYALGEKGENDGFRPYNYNTNALGPSHWGFYQENYTVAKKQALLTCENRKRG